MNQIREQVAAQLGVAVDDVEVNADLIGLGLDSIRMMKIAGSWRKRGHDVNFAQLAAAPTVSAWAELIGVTTEPTVADTLAPVIDSAPTEAFGLAPMQHAYWIGRSEGQDLGGVAAHLYVEFDGAGVDPGVLRAAVGGLAAAHPMLRAQILPDGTQRILPAPGREVFSVVDLRDLADDELDQQLRSIRDTKSSQVLPISDGQVFDITLSLLPQDRTRLHVDVDMIAGDAMSYRTMLADLASLYHGARLSAVDFTYRDYLAWRSANPDPARDRDRDWWTERLPELPAAPALPLVPQSQRSDSGHVVRHHHWIDAEAKAALAAAARERGVTMAMALASVFAESIARWSSAPRFLLNLPLFHREPAHPDVDRLVGDFTTSVLLDVDASVPTTIVDRARQIQKTMHANGSHASYSGLEVLRDLGRLRGEQVLAPVVYTSAINLGELFSGEVISTFGEPEWIVSQGPQVLLDAQVTELRGGLLLNWDVRESAFYPGVVDAMFAQYRGAVDRLTMSDAAWEADTTGHLPLDQRAVRDSVNATDFPTSNDVLHEGFFRWAQTTPDAPAIRSGADGLLTYREVCARALAVAGALRDAGVRQGQAVAVQLPKGPDQIIATLGILAAGATYVPVGHDQPAARRAHILTAGDVVAWLGVDATSGQQPEAMVSLTYADAAGHRNPLAQAVIPDPETPAYVLFTSGSTGVPKGVEVPHRAVMNTIEDLHHRFGVTAADSALLVSNLEFDLSIYDIFGLWGVGGAVVTLTDAERADPDTWVDLIDRHAITLLACVPSLLDMLLNATPTGSTALTSVRAVFLGGDWVGVDLPRRMAAHSPAVRVAGLGGTTETAIHATICETVDPPAQWAAVPYGVPLHNVQCRVVDAAGNDCPDWVAGELWIGGAGVALGYRNDLERTADRFVRRSGQNWYRTGDLARYWPDGCLEFLGRADHQVKIRGYRVELGEVEGALRLLPGVHRAVASVITSAAPKLVAAVSPEAGVELDHDEVLEGLRELLPGYMIPGHLLIIEAFPITSNGKLDRRAVQTLLETGEDELTFEAPRTALERALAQIVGELLDLDEVGRGDDFFSLGGDSVLATTLIARIREWLDAPRAGVADVFSGRTIAAIADRLMLSDNSHDRLEQVAEMYLDVLALDDDDLSHLVPE
ncbi:amino acid adenylation domain-containing protein [Williamsia sp. 1138]|uniref:non-ribosomal peptide synthetase n=1 Tax=Williamsia sp. 1138 TaxID=1903117 RepID=UPI001FEE1A12|nr:amino acid adenylation domain-containing protein [Williamsia sp. 1138]